jgi:hypothetical protein
MVEREAIIVNSHFHFRKGLIASVFLWQFFPVAHSIIRHVANCSTDEAEITIYDCVFMEDFLYYLKWVAC